MGITNEEALIIVKGVLKSVQGKAKDTACAAYVPGYGFITYEKVKKCIERLETNKHGNDN